MIKFICTKILRIIILLFIICVVSYLILVFSPIDILHAQFGSMMTTMSAEQRMKIIEFWGLNKPPLERFTDWFLALLKGDLGYSIIYRMPVKTLIKDYFFNTFFIMLSAWIVSGVLGLVLGVISAIYKNKWIDKIIKVYSLIIASSPKFWLALLFLIFFSGYLKWFPIGMAAPIGKTVEEISLATRIHHLILPAITLSFVSMSDIILHTRAKLLQVLSTDYILFAKANNKSMSRIIFEHSLRNILLPAITIQFLSFSELFGGAVFIEKIFSLPGLGSLVQEAGTKGDVALLLGIVIISAIWIFIGNLIADLLYFIIDPRIKEQWKNAK